MAASTRWVLPMLFGLLLASTLAPTALRAQSLTHRNGPSAGETMERTPGLMDASMPLPVDAASEALRHPAPALLHRGPRTGYLLADEGGVDLEAMIAQSTGSRRGRTFMIAGGAAFVGGLLIGGTAGNLVAAGGVALGVYGIILYF
ncbi:MAG: hypothetical protein P8188_16920 [Gemmatimonadota bacterium]|jgi:hypothetical protein